jgi:hypothetical protein
MEFTNFPYGTVKTAPSPATTGTSIVLETGEGDEFPDSGYFRAIICPIDARPLSSNAEIVTAIKSTGDTFTLVRDVENTTARSVQVGDQFFLAPTKSIFDSIVSGWVEIMESWTYSSWDDTNGVSTGVVTVATGAASRYSVGMRVKFSQPTDGDKEGIITKVTDTTLTIFINTDYDLDNEALSDIYISTSKAPQGFDLDPSKYTVEVSDTSQTIQSSPTANTWYNLGSNSIDIPIGSWDVTWHATGRVHEASASSSVQHWFTLSTANNSESDVDFTAWNSSSNITGSQNSDASLTRSKTLNLSTKDTYYLNIKTADTGVNDLRLRGDVCKMIIRAVLSYL